MVLPPVMRCLQGVGVWRTNTLWDLGRALPFHSDPLINQTPAWHHWIAGGRSRSGRYWPSCWLRGVKILSYTGVKSCELVRRSSRSQNTKMRNRHFITSAGRGASLPWLQPWLLHLPYNHHGIARAPWLLICENELGNGWGWASDRTLCASNVYWVLALCQSFWQGLFIKFSSILFTSPIPLWAIC